MNPLPLPNWNRPPSQFTGELLMRNIHRPAQPGPYGFAPFMPPQPSHGPTHQLFPPRPPFYGHNQQFYQQQHEINSKIENSNKSTCQLTDKKQDFSCDVCERFFDTKKILETHLATHVKCEQEGCSFQASRKVLKLHFIQNHAKGRMRIILDTPEQIEKWKEQRRKKYPTVANVEKKLAEENAKREKGQVAQDRTYRYRGRTQRINGHQKRGQNHRKKRKFTAHHDRNQDHNNPEHNGQNISCQAGIESTLKEKKQHLQDGDPLSLVLLGSDSNSDGEDVTTEKTFAVKEPETNQSTTPGTVSALTSLCASYGDMSSDEDTKPDEINNNNDEPSIERTDHCSFVTEDLKTKTLSRPERRKRTREKGPKKNMIKKAKTKHTLLEKLLAPEMRHESNVVLQCLRYIVKKNFFEVSTQESTHNCTSQ